MQDRRALDRTVSLGNFLVATFVLAGGLIACWVQINVQRAEDHAKLEILTAQRTEDHNRIEGVQQQQTTLLIEMGKLNGKMETIIQQLTTVNDDGKRKTK